MSTESAEFETVQVGARVSDPELIEALEEAEDECGSTSAAVRRALREAYADERDGDGDAENLPARAERALMVLQEEVGPSRTMAIGGASSLVANECNIKKEDLKATVWEPLRREGKIAVMQGIEAVSIEVVADE